MINSSIAIKFNDLLIEDIFIEKDTFYLQVSYMNMDFFDALAGDYNVKKIVGDRVNLKLKVDSSETEITTSGKAIHKKTRYSICVKTS